MTIARIADLNLPEYAAFNHGRNHSRMRRWELPFALFQARLAPMMAILDCTINPENFQESLLSLYPHTLYRHWNPIAGEQFTLAAGVPDQAFDRAYCINTLEHLLQPQRAALLAELARKLKPGGLLIITCDYYFDDFWQRPELLQMGVMRADRQELFNGWNLVRPYELLQLAAQHDLHPTHALDGEPEAADPELYRNLEPYPHATIGFVFSKGIAPLLPAGQTVVLSLLTWNTRDVSLEALQACLLEAAMLQRLGQQPFIVVCDNGSTDGTQEALRALDEQINIPHQFILNTHNWGSSIARNQIIDVLLARKAHYLLFIDGDIEIVPFSSYAMLRHMEDSGRLLGTLWADTAGYTTSHEQATRYLFSLNRCQIRHVNWFASTGYGLFRREIFEAGVRFEEAEPFDRAGWGFEDNDLAFQIHAKGYYNQQFFGLTYLHRYPNSSMQVMRSLGMNLASNIPRRKEYVIRKWQDTPEINGDPLDVIRQILV